MVSMKTDSKDIAEYTPSPYGYGTCLCLNEEQVKALGLSESPPEAGATLVLRARAVVKRVTQDVDPEDGDEKEYDPDVSMELQITDMEVEHGGASLASRLYGEG